VSQSRIKLTDQFRNAILAAPRSRYWICKAVGMSQATMSRFMHGHGGLSCDMQDRIADVLDLNIVAGQSPPSPAKKRVGRKPGAKPPGRERK
jgi:hypothetical protein